MPAVNSRHWDVIVDALAGGDIVDPGGLATQKLQAVTGHESTNALAKILRRMEEDGLVEREVSGRRTFRIGLTAEAKAKQPARQNVAAPAAETSGEMDYDLLAAALLAKALKAQQIQEQGADVKGLQQRVERAEAARRIAEADAQAARAKVAELEATMRQLEKNLAIVSAAAEKPHRDGVSVSERISPAEKRALRELQQLLQTPPTRRG